MKEKPVLLLQQTVDRIMLRGLAVKINSKSGLT
jgi:hypothetical protein